MFTQELQDKVILTFILGFSTMDLKLKKDGLGLVMSSGLQENKA